MQYRSCQRIRLSPAIDVTRSINGSRTWILQLRGIVLKTAVGLLGCRHWNSRRHWRQAGAISSSPRHWPVRGICIRYRRASSATRSAGGEFLVRSFCFILDRFGNWTSSPPVSAPGARISCAGTSRKTTRYRHRQAGTRSAFPPADLEFFEAPSARERRWMDDLLFGLLRSESREVCVKLASRKGDGGAEIIEQDRVIGHSKNSDSGGSLSRSLRPHGTKEFTAAAVLANRISSASFWSRPARPSAARSRSAFARRSGRWRNPPSG